MMEDESRADWLYLRCRGVCEEPLREEIRNPSMLAVKSFPKVASLKLVSALNPQAKGIVDLLCMDV